MRVIFVVSFECLALLKMWQRHGTFPESFTETSQKPVTGVFRTLSSITMEFFAKIVQDVRTLAIFSKNLHRRALKNKPLSIWSTLHQQNKLVLNFSSYQSIKFSNVFLVPVKEVYCKWSTNEQIFKLDEKEIEDVIKYHFEIFPQKSNKAKEVVFSSTVCFTNCPFNFHS